MRQETQGVTQTLLESARKEFMEYGFHNASMRRISSHSGVSTNSIYTRFGDKNGLFAAIVENVAEELMEVYLKSIEAAKHCSGIDGAVDAGENGTYNVLKYIYEHHDEIMLIFCHAQGTEYEDYFDRLARIEEEYYKEFAGEYNQNGNKIDDFFIHVHCRMGWQYIYELLSHNKSYEEAIAFMKNVTVFHNAGWKAILDL